MKTNKLITILVALGMSLFAFAFALSESKDNKWHQRCVGVDSERTTREKVIINKWDADGCIPFVFYNSSNRLPHG